MKYALDTSVLVRILANKPQPLAGDVIASVARRMADGDIMVVPDIILPGAYYAMQHHYGVDKGTIINSLVLHETRTGCAWCACTEVCPPPPIASKRRVDCLYAALHSVLEAPLAAVVFAFAAAAFGGETAWVDERAATTGQTGSWTEGVAYDPATQTADICGDAARDAMEARSDERSERAEEKASGTTPELRKAVAALLVQAARRVNAVNEVAPTEATAAAISKVAALVEEYKLVASQFKGKKKTDPEPEPEPAPEPETPTT